MQKFVPGRWPRLEEFVSIAKGHRTLKFMILSRFSKVMASGKDGRQSNVGSLSFPWER
jgi:hypothetical protein